METIKRYAKAILSFNPVIHQCAGPVHAVRAKHQFCAAATAVAAVQAPGARGPARRRTQRGERCGVARERDAQQARGDGRSHDGARTGARTLRYSTKVYFVPSSSITARIFVHTKLDRL